MANPKPVPLDALKRWVRLSGFPFENEAAAILRAVPDLKVRQPYPFSAMDPDGRTVLRSLDFRCTFLTRARKNKPWKGFPGDQAHLELLVDAKWSEDDQYLFVPDGSARSHLSFATLEPRASERGPSGSRTDGMLRGESFGSVLLDGDLPICRSGRKLSEATKERESLIGMQVQVLQALDALVGELASFLCGSVEGGCNTHNIFVVVPLIVTNAKLGVLKENLTTDMVASMETADDLCMYTDAVVALQPDSATLLADLAARQVSLGKRQCAEMVWGATDLTTCPVVFVARHALGRFVERLVSRFHDAVNPPSEDE